MQGLNVETCGNLLIPSFLLATLGLNSLQKVSSFPHISLRGRIASYSMSADIQCIKFKEIYSVHFVN